MSEQHRSLPRREAPAVRIEITDWAKAEAQVMPVRIAVFVVEQRVPEDIERDEFDAVSRHAIARDAASTVVATGRLLPDGHIGRMAVLVDWRGRGVGTALLETLILEATRLGMAQLVLSAQTHALGFYARFGFVPEGDAYDEAGLLHQAMRKNLAG